jgi:hypothetical protein
MVTSIPGDSCVLKRLLHDTVEAASSLHLMPVGTARITEPFNIDDNDRLVNSQPSIHLLSQLGQGKADCHLIL